MGISRQLLILYAALAMPMVLAQAPLPGSAHFFRSAQMDGSEAIQAGAWQIVLLANQARAAAGVRPLRWDQALAVAARLHCLRMAAEGKIAHRYANEPGLSARAAQAGAHFSLIEENVAMAADPASIHDAWMQSPGHRANLLNAAVDRVGVAVVAVADGVYAVADYERSVPLLTQAQVENTVTGMVRAGGVAILPDASLARAACATDNGLPRPSTGPRPRFIMRWQDADLTQLPEALTDKLATGKYRQAAVGSCPPQGQEGPFTAYRIAVLLY